MCVCVCDSLIPSTMKEGPRCSCCWDSIMQKKEEKEGRKEGGGKAGRDL